MKHIFLYSIIFFSFHVQGQDCDPELLRQKPGNWKAGPQGFIQNVIVTDLAKEKAVLTTIHKQLTNNYIPTGCEVSYSTIYGKQLNAASNWKADPFHYMMYILPYLCNNKGTDKAAYHVAIASATNVTIAVNVLFSLNNLYAANLPGDDFRGYLKLKHFPQKREGAWLLGEEVVGDKGTSSEIWEYNWLITYNDTLPFSYLSRKEYLLLQLKRLEKDLKDSPGEREYTNRFISNINQYLQKPESELRIPAICRWNEEERFEKFVEEGTAGSFIAVKPNLDYYHKNLPKSSPQFMNVVFTVSKGDPVFEENIDKIRKGIDFMMLKNMLGK